MNFTKQTNSGKITNITITPDGKYTVYFTGSEGKNMRQLVEGTEDVWGTFTPDGKFVIFQRGLTNKKNYSLAV